MNRLLRIIFTWAPFVFICTNTLGNTVEDFVRPADVESIKISPTGKYLAITKRFEGREGISIIDLATNEAVSGTHFGEDTEVWRFMWATDDRLLIEPAWGNKAFSPYKAPTGEIFRLDTDGSDVEALFGFRAIGITTGTHIKRRSISNAFGEIIDDFKSDPNFVLIEAIPAGNNFGNSEAYLLNTRNGTKRKVASSKIRTGSFATDGNGNVLFNYGWNYETGDYELFTRKSDKDEFTLAYTSKMGDGRLIPIRNAKADSAYYFLDSRDGTTLGLTQINDDFDMKGKNVFKDPSVDINSVYTIRENGQIYAVKYYDHYPKYSYPDPTNKISKAHAAISAKFKDSDVVFTSITSDLSRAVVYVYSDRNPGDFYLLDVEELKLNKLFSARPWIDKQKLKEMRPFELKARDGTPLRGYITLPEANKNKKLPAVVLVHGGPYRVQDKWTYNNEVQLLASQGYAVIQVNFRGSGGQGEKFVSAGLRGWGTTIQDDITDATKWAIATGLIDKNRICIYGGSFGAYSALNGVVKEPDLYQCAIGVAGIYDLPMMYDKGDIQSYKGGVAYLKQALGEDEEELKSRSPVFNAKHIKAKVMLAHGKKDRRAPIEHSEKMAAALKAEGNPAIFIKEGLERHGIQGIENQKELYSKMFEFLEDAIGVN